MGTPKRPLYLQGYTEGLCCSPCPCLVPLCPPRAPVGCFESRGKPRHVVFACKNERHWSGVEERLESLLRTLGSGLYKTTGYKLDPTSCAYVQMYAGCQQDIYHQHNISCIRSAGAGEFWRVPRPGRSWPVLANPGDMIRSQWSLQNTTCRELFLACVAGDYV